MKWWMLRQALLTVHSLVLGSPVYYFASRYIDAKRRSLVLSFHSLVTMIPPDKPLVQY